MKPLRIVILALAVAWSGYGATLWLGGRGEAFWLLFPAWALLGAALGVIPFPRQPARSRAMRWTVAAILFLLPTGLYLLMMTLLGGKFAWREWLLAVYFFAFSVEILLLYYFRAGESIRERLARGRARAGRLAIAFGVKTALYALLVPLLLSTFALHRIKVPAGPIDPRLELPQEEVSFPSRGPRPLRLAGSFFPLRSKAGTAPKGTVLACHGVAANRGDLQGIVWILHHAGFQILTFDFRGHGESDGHTVTYGLEERRDVCGAYDYLLSRVDVDPERLFALGVSMGAASLLQALPEMPRLRAVVADSSFADLESMVRHQYRYFPRAAAAPLASLTSLFGWLETGIRVDEVSPRRAIEGLRVPIFFIHGGEDRVIPPRESERLHEAYRGPKRLRMVPGAGHGGASFDDPDRYGKEVAEFFLSGEGR